MARRSDIDPADRAFIEASIEDSAGRAGAVKGHRDRQSGALLGANGAGRRLKRRSGRLSMRRLRRPRSLPMSPRLPGVRRSVQGDLSLEPGPCTAAPRLQWVFPSGHGGDGKWRPMIPPH
jgi:hypothetical protein